MHFSTGKIFIKFRKIVNPRLLRYDKIYGSNTLQCFPKLDRKEKIMAISSKKSIKKLPKFIEEWLLVVQELRIWIDPPDEEAYRPYGALVFNLSQGLIQNMGVMQSTPTIKEIKKALFEGMLRTPSGSTQPPHRPENICMLDENLVEALAPLLEDLGIRSSHEQSQEIQELAADVFSELESHLASGPGLPGLLEQENISPELVGDLFNAAAEFYRAAPWVHLTNLQYLSIQVEPEKNLVTQ